MTDRILPLEGVLNFRDYGGYATTSGGTLRRGRLYRSAHHGRATDADLAAMADLGIAVIVDLRRPNERRREPSRRPQGFDGQVIESDLGDVDDDPWWSFVRQSDLSEEAFRQYLMDYYRNAPFEPRHVDLYARYFQALGEADGAVLIHCAAGKDRTGLLAALTHHLTGVSREDLIADYLLTNVAISFEQRMPLMVQAISEGAGREPSEAAVRVAMGVDEAYLLQALAAIEAAHGDLDAYLEAVLGVDQALRERISARLVG
ncbi:tyrosine-protein phosphatase [Phenylobacterium montanum]|uniref:Tyrosine-protein phosphatase n=1 Tax=Phenylobacterium montanum TaxID=2823693 RepID=A0A975FX19_9CAUL|nr:tyrosine-protein phosphatase [Caulobacter sp. S6]QUD86721.1 tyrosine-protein phosphatase [Caulobacter sp. S6]